MRRGVLALDRIAALLIGLVLLAGGVGVAAWGVGRLTQVWAAAPPQLHLKTATTAYAASWWTAASGIGGAVLLLLALWWLLAHLPRRGTGPLRLPGSGRTGALALDGGSAVAVAARVLTEARGVQSATGHLVHERGHLIAALRVTVDATSDLDELSSDLDRVTAELGQVLGRDDVRCRVRVRVARRSTTMARVS